MDKETRLFFQQAKGSAKMEPGFISALRYAKISPGGCHFRTPFWGIPEIQWSQASFPHSIMRKFRLGAAISALHFGEFPDGLDRLISMGYGKEYSEACAFARITFCHDLAAVFLNNCVRNG